MDKPSVAPVAVDQTHRPARGIDRLLDVMAKLRDPNDGCPWDLAQRAETIVPHTIEEAYEVAEALETGDTAAELDELGDLLFQVVFYAQLASEDDRFTFDDIAASHAEKMVSRHPHVFTQEYKDLSPNVHNVWEEGKARERAEKAALAGKAKPSVLDGITQGLPAATRATKLQKRAARVGFDWLEIEQVVDKLDEEMSELKELLENSNPKKELEAIEDELGDVLFAVVNLARHLEIDPERALRGANRKFERRFRVVEQTLEAKEVDLVDVGLDEMEAAWRQAKEAERR
ncbi:MAG: nucleoside triphosphate pyrophosphohydrolase [Pseudomonadota bacterium]